MTVFCGRRKQPGNKCSWEQFVVGNRGWFVHGFDCCVCALCDGLISARGKGFL